MKKRTVRIILATAVFSAIVGAMGETLAFLIYRLDEWVDESDGL